MAYDWNGFYSSQIEASWSMEEG